MSEHHVNHPPPPPDAVKKIFLWHRGALGDILLAGPALEGLAAHYPAASFALCGSPARLSLLRQNLRVHDIWDSQARQWTPLFMANSPPPPALKSALGDFDLAVLCTPHPQPDLAARLQAIGIKFILWLPSFPQHELMPVAQFQARHLASEGIRVDQRSFRLHLEPREDTAARKWFSQLTTINSGPEIALAPGSGHSLKNWPLARYRELARRLTKELGGRVWWILGPAEEGWKRQLPAQTHPAEAQVLDALPLPTLAARLQLCQLYIGNDSGITHLAAATGGPPVVAIFGPTDRRIWAPLGPQVTILSSSLDCAPCTQGRALSCQASRCLQELTVEEVFSTVSRIFK